MAASGVPIMTLLKVSRHNFIVHIVRGRGSGDSGDGRIATGHTDPANALGRLGGVHILVADEAANEG
jgi:hypothetical protein